jgi:hypothetical protein
VSFSPKYVYLYAYSYEYLSSDIYSPMCLYAPYTIPIGYGEDIGMEKLRVGWYKGSVAQT